MYEELTSSKEIRLNALKAAGLIVLIYLVVATLWIFLSDNLITLLVSSIGNPDDAVARVEKLQTIKGMGFVLTTALLLLILTFLQLHAVHRARATASKERDRYRQLLDNLPGAAYEYIRDDKWTPIYVSDGCHALTGYTPEEIYEGKVSIGEFICPEFREENDRLLDEALKNKTVFSNEVQIFTGGGERKWIWKTVRGKYDLNGNLISVEGFAMDIEDRRRAQEIDQIRRNFEERYLEQERAMSIVSHELRAPLTSIRAGSELLLTDSVDEEDAKRKLLEDMNAQSMRMNRMLTEMLEAARLKSGKAKWNWRQFCLKFICTDAIRVLQPMVDESKLQLTMDVPEDIELQGDADAIQRVLINMVANAVRHTDEGRVHVSARIVDDKEERKVTIQIEDTGQGMSRETAEKLGEPFALNSGVQSEKQSSGTGLGLAICRQIVAAHAGIIYVTSAPGAGTTFNVILPQNRDEPTLEQEMAPISFKEAAAYAS